ncbi:MAG TPA: polyprenyl synthetase family protein [Desulfatiglandales bacterium]|nr:polyprenyl synthetase family protein [Desulfatiglandales bacterium]
MKHDRIFLNRFKKDFQKIEKEMNSSFSSRVKMIEDIGRHSLLGEGKRLRPLLFVLSGRLCEYDRDDIYCLSTIFEYLHNASLLHDDVIDNADIRRNKPSASSVWGNSAAVLTGDFLSTKAMSIALGTDNTGFMSMMIDTAARMTEGQFLELMHADNLNTSKEEYMEIIVSKTAELTAASCAGAAMIAGAGNEETEDLRKFGLNFGIHFQLVDDLLDYTLSEEQFGKPVGKDLREGKVTLPLIYALSKMDKKDLRRFRKIFRDHKAGEKDYEDLIMMVRDSENIKKIRGEAMTFMEKAFASLKKFPESPYKEDLIALNRCIAERNS